MGRKPKPPKPPRPTAISYQFKVTEIADVSNPALSKTSGITFEVAPPTSGPPPPTDNFIDDNGVQDFVDQNGVTLFVDQNNILLGTH